MDAITLLKSDHETVAGIFEKLEDTTERAEKTREELFTRLKGELGVHAHIEETIFYPSIKRAAETHDIVLEGFEEHHVIKVLLGELAEMPVDTEEWGAKLKVLKENVEHHVEEEEGDMFPKSREVLSKEQIEELGTQMEAEKENKKKQLSATA